MLLYRSSSVRSFFTSQSYLPSIDYDGLGFPKSKMHHSTPLKLYHRDPIVLIEQCKMHFPTPLGSIPLRLCRPGRRVFCFPINSDIRSRLHMPFPSSPSINWFIGFVSVFFFFFFAAFIRGPNVRLHAMLPFTNRRSFFHSLAWPGWGNMCMSSR